MCLAGVARELARDGSWRGTPALSQIVEASSRIRVRAMDHLEISTRNTRQGVAVLDIRGELDISTSPDVKTKVRDLIRAGHTRLVLNLGRVDFVDSTGLGVLVGA